MNFKMSKKPKETKEENIELQTVVKTLVNNICCSEEFINQLTKSLSKVIEEQYGDRIQRLEKVNETLKTKLQAYEETIKNINKRNEKFEQMSKNKAIRIYGVKEVRNEVVSKTILDIVNNKIKVNSKGKELKLKEIDIEDCFRIGKLQQGKKRPIFVNFLYQNMKNEIYNSKKALKGSGIVIREDLTREKLEILKLLIKKINKDGIIWTNHGRIHVKMGETDNIIQIDSKEDLCKIDIQ